jgi:hypothetical protein
MMEVDKITIKLVKKLVKELTPAKGVSSMKDIGPEKSCHS